MKYVFDDQVQSQPDAVAAVLSRPAPPRLDVTRPLLFAGLGTSLHACRVAAAWAGFPAAAVDAHELALRLPVPRGAQVVVVTHGGRGQFAAAVLAKARAAGAATFAVVGEGAPELAADFLLRTCPQERAETHSVSYVTALAVLGRMLGVEMSTAPQLLRDALATALPDLQTLAACSSVLVAGFGLDAITAAEAALKLKEATLKWAEGFAVEQALHGPHAALGEGMGAILIPPFGDDGGRTAALRTVCQMRRVSVVTPELPACPEALRPLAGVVPLQRLTAELARLCGGDPDTGISPTANGVDRDLRRGPLARAWLAAAHDLGIRFETPFAFEARGKKYVCTGLLPDFGRKKGTLICSRVDPAPDDVFEAAAESGFYTSALSPLVYERYDRAKFIETLNDWGWFGESARVPAWFRGHKYESG